MSVAAETAVRDWTNSLTGTLVGTGKPLANGAYLISQRSPASGSYVIVARQAGSEPAPVAEGTVFDRATILAEFRAGTHQAAELAAAAWASAVEALTGRPVPMGDDVTCLCSDNLSGPHFIEPAPDRGEQYAFQVTADFLLRSN